MKKKLKRILKLNMLHPLFTISLSDSTPFVRGTNFDIICIIPLKLSVGHMIPLTNGTTLKIIMSSLTWLASLDIADIKSP